VSINVNREFVVWLKQPKLLQSPRKHSTEITEISGNDWWNKNVFSCRRKEEKRADCTSCGSVL